MIEFKAGRIELSKWSKKYPRTAIKNKGGDRTAHKIVQWCRNNWIDDRYTDMNYTKIRKFLLLSNIYHLTSYFYVGRLRDVTIELSYCLIL